MRLERSAEGFVRDLRKAQKHLSRAENALGRAGLEIPEGFDKVGAKVWDWAILTRRLQAALYQEAIKIVQEKEKEDDSQ